MVTFIRMPAISARLREPLAAALRGEKIDWPQPLSDDEIDALVEHGVAPLVYAAAGVPQLRDVAMSAAVAEPLRLRELRAVLDGLAARGVRPLILKGSALAYSMYAAGELRPRMDCDLLIEGAEMEIVAEVFAALGYEAAINSGDELGIRQRSFSRTDEFDVSHNFDVHVAIANTAVFASVLRYDELLSRAVAVPRIGEHALRLSNADALLHACIHRVAHHHNSDRLIWLCDIHLLRRSLTRDELRDFWQLAADRRVVAVCRRAFELEASWFGSAGDAAEQWLTREQLEADEPSRAFLDRGRTYGELLVTNLAALSWSGRLKRLRQLAFPPRQFMYAQFGGGSPAALPLLYAYRGLRGVARLFRKLA